MKKVSLSGSPRENVGKKDANELRRSGRVPAVLYGGKEQTHFHVNYTDMRKLVINPEVFQVEIDIDGKKTNSIIKEVQQHPVTDKITHVDFLELNEKKPVKVGVPVKLVGVAPGVINGGRLSQVFRKLKVVALPGNLPAELEVDISNLKIGDSIRVGDLREGGLNILTEDRAVIVAVKAARKMIVEEEVEEEGEGAEGAEAAAEGGDDAAKEGEASE